MAQETAQGGWNGSRRRDVIPNAPSSRFRRGVREDLLDLLEGRHRLSYDDPRVRVGVRTGCPVAAGV